MPRFIAQAATAETVSGSDCAQLLRVKRLMLYSGEGHEHLRGLIMTYKGEKQAGDYACVFASVGPAVNSVADKMVWTQHTLFSEWEKQKIADANFANVHPIAVEPVKSDVKAQHHVDGATAISKEDYLKMIKECIDRGGVAIVSLEHADLAGSKLNRKKSWHMLSLIGRKGNDFEAWDTAAGTKMTATADQLVNHVPYGDGILAVHDKHDVLLIQPVLGKLATGAGSSPVGSAPEI